MSTTMKLHDFIHTFKSLSKEDCTTLRWYFEEYDDHHVRNDNPIQQFTEMNLNGFNAELAQFFARKIPKLIERYQDQIPMGDRFFPVNYGLEEFRIKRYNEGTDHFQQHVDVGDLTSCKRFLAFLFYLNDDFEGGGTLFRTPEHRYIKPEPGKVLIFPPTWQYPHEGLPVNKGTKYIMSTYLHYV